MLFFFVCYSVVFREKSTEEPKEKVSMAVLLTQGLMANDASKVDTVLRENRLDLIQVSGIGIF